MIKKIMTVLSMLILSTALTWAVWEGNAVAGSQEEFPAGLFASSDLFPKYTLIEITNLEQDITSRAVVIDNEGAQGVLVKVSPDLARVLAIKEDSTVRIRVSIPPLVAEEGADPVLLGKVEERQPTPTAVPEKPAEEAPQTSPVEAAPIEEPVQPAEKPIQEDNNRKGPYEEPIQNEAVIQNEPVPPEVAEPVKPAVEPKGEKNEEVAPMTVAEIETPVQPEPEEPVSPIAEVEEPTQPEKAPEEPMAPIAEVEEPSQLEKTPAAPAAPVAEVSEPVLPEPEIVPAPAAVSEVAEPVEFSASSEYSAEAEKPVLDAPPIQEAPIEEESESSAEYTKPVVQVAEIAVPETASGLDALLSPVPEVSTPIEPEPVTVDEAESEKDMEKPTVEPELPAVEPKEESEELQDEPEVVIAKEVLAGKEPKDDTTEDDLITENHVMLVPSEPRVPMKEYIPAPKEPEQPALPASPVVTQPAEELYTANVLTKGAFYVQIGWFKDMLNVESFVQRYGKQYPIAVEKSPMTKGIFYKVYIGPLKKDERGAILENFQKLGFKDAFLKKAP